MKMDANALNVCMRVPVKVGIGDSDRKFTQPQQNAYKLFASVSSFLTGRMAFECAGYYAL